MSRQVIKNFWERIFVLVMVLGISLTLIFPGEAKASSTIKPLLPIDLILTPAPAESTHLPANIAYGGGRYLTVWTEYYDHIDWPNGYQGDIRAQFVNTSGKLEDVSFVISHNVIHEDAPAIAFNGTNFLVTWYTNYGIKAQLISP